MKSVVNIDEYNELKRDFEVLTGNHREITHLVLFKVIKFKYDRNLKNNFYILFIALYNSDMFYDQIFCCK